MCCGEIFMSQHVRSVYPNLKVKDMQHKSERYYSMIMSNEYEYEEAGKKT